MCVNLYFNESQCAADMRCALPKNVQRGKSLLTFGKHHVHQVKVCKRVDGGANGGGGGWLQSLSASKSD